MDFTVAIRHLQGSISVIPEIVQAIQQNDLEIVALCFERVADAETKAYTELSRVVDAAF